MKTRLLKLICLSVVLSSAPVWAESDGVPSAAIQALPTIMPESAANAENCDKSSGGCKQMGDMRNMMSSMMHAAGDMVDTVSPGCKTAATQADQSAQSRLQAMQMMMSGMMH
jgi:hypothetical protein